MEFPTPDEIFRAHDRILRETGGEPGVLQRGAVEAACERARWGPFVESGDLAERAAFLLRGLAQDHPFADGNKRTAFEAADNFLQSNGCRLSASLAESVSFMLAVARGETDVVAIAGWLRPRLEKLYLPAGSTPEREP